MKKLFGLIIVLMCVLCVFAVPIKADAVTEGYYTYEVSSGEATITDVDNSIGGDITIPSTLGGYPVTSIGSGAFENCTSLTAITIPNSVTSIEHRAFFGCTSLTAVTIPDSVTYIGDSAFGICTSLTTVNIPDSVTSIESGAFGECTSLTAVTIPDSVTYIGNGAFSICTSLTTVNIPDSVTSIESTTFAYCTSLTTVNIPDSVTRIGVHAFYNCSSLTSVTIPESLTSIEIGAFGECNVLADVYFTGTQAEWDAIAISPLNDLLLYAKLTVEYVPPHACVYGEWELIVKPTFTATGQQQKVCSVCGDKVTETIDVLVGKVSQWNVTVTDDLRVNFHLNISECIEDTARVRIAVGEEEHTLRVSELEKTEAGLYIAGVNIAAAQMTDSIFITVLNGSDLAETASCTVRGYADTILADEINSKYHPLVRQMLNYGAMAQVYFDYNIDNLANQGITGVAATDVPETAEDMTVSDKISGLNFHGASLVYRDRIAVRYYFTGDVSGCTFAANGNTYTPVAKDGMYYVEIADILPQNLDQQITLTVTDASGNTLSVAYGPMNYIVRMNQKGSDTLKALVKALYNYHLAAKALSA